MATLYTGLAAAKLACDSKYPYTRKPSKEAFDAFAARWPEVIDYADTTKKLVQGKNAYYDKLMKDDGGVPEEGCKALPVGLQLLVTPATAERIAQTKKGRDALDVLLGKGGPVRPDSEPRPTPIVVVPGYEIREIPYAAQKLVWIDNEWVLFSGYHRTSKSDEAGKTTGEPPALYKWNTRSGQIIEIMKTGRYTRLCYDRGYVYLRFEGNGAFRTYVGQLDRGLSRSPTEGAPIPRNAEFNIYNCRVRAIPAATQSDRGVITVLRDDHGFIEGERPSEPFPQRRYFLVHNSGEVIEIPLPCGARGPRFSRFSDAYVYQDGGGLSGANVERHVCVIGVKGPASNYLLPKGPWLDGSVYGFPARPGLLMVSAAILSKAEGLYLVSHDRTIQIAKGYINEFAISPDGCRVAANIDLSPRSVSQIAVIDVCKKGP